MTRDIHHTWFLPHSPDKVWQYLTEPQLLAQWLMENDFKPIVGHSFQFRTKPIVKFGFDGIVNCEVLEVVPKKRLSYTWKGGSGGKVSLDSKVTWTLTPKDDGTELLLAHTGFKGLKNFFASIVMQSGWSKIANRMKDLMHARP